MIYTPRKRQQEAIDKMIKFLRSKSAKKGIFIYPTSFGKSIIIANVASQFPDKYFINVTTSKELLKQNYEKFTSYGFEADICSASLGSKNVGKITFATIGTLIKQVKFFENKDVVIVSDECDKGSKKGSQLYKFLKQVKNAKLVGLTATPLRLKAGMNGTELKMMNRDRDCFYSSIEDVVQIEEVVNDGFWSNLIYEVRDIDEDSLELNQSGTEYTDESLKVYSEQNEIAKQCGEEAQKLIDEGRKSILIFVPFINDALEVSKHLIGCEAIYSGMDNKERDRIVSGFKDLSIQTVVNVGILAVGFDHPQLDAIIFARPTNSITIWYQGLGRGVRKHELKKDCKVVDLSGNYNTFGRIEDINFQDDVIYGGWAAFSGDRLLTNYPLGMENVPTKQSLKEAFDLKNQSESWTQTEIFFGKYKDKKLGDIIKDFEGKNYLAWITDPKTKFNFYGEKGLQLKSDIYKALKLPIPVPVKEVKKEPYRTQKPQYTKDSKELINNHVEKIKNFTDLSSVF